MNVLGEYSAVDPDSLFAAGTGICLDLPRLLYERLRLFARIIEIIITYGQAAVHVALRRYRWAWVDCTIVQ